MDFSIEGGADGIRVLSIGPPPNEFNPAFLDGFGAALDAVESDPAATGLVTVGADKHYSNGFELAHLAGLADPMPFVERSCRLLARLLVFPLPTVAAVNGHAFGIGAMLALAHDQRVMNSERGWLCLPEIDMGLRLHPFMQELVVARLGSPAATDAVIGGGRYDGAAAAAAGFVHEVAPAESVVGVAVSLAHARAGRDRGVTAAIKTDLFGPILARLPPA
ncbi:MAG TPA: enoyl-CoA hydratase/isomerase family protein [Acidimicrobiales bacterium]|jgi:enoyl-CoA hydratase/carnithine racemase|nr:enoyl-CoA hydratase/isomerase family protein [Acidimicrobiales bacterium]